MFGTQVFSWLRPAGIAILAAVASLALPEPASANVIVREKTKLYRVSGTTGQQIYKDIERKGPRLGKKKGHFVATATISFDIDKPRGGAWGNRCLVLGADIVVNVTYTIPEWTGRAKSSPALQRAWDNFLAHIWRHEKQHAKIAKDTGYEIWRVLKSLKGDLRKDCKGIADGLDAKMKQIIKRHEERQARFDSSIFGDGGQVFRFDRALVAAK